MSHHKQPSQSTPQHRYPTRKMYQNTIQNKQPNHVNNDGRNSRHVRFSNSTDTSRPTPVPIASNTSSTSSTSSASRSSRSSRVSNEKTTLKKIREDLEIRERKLRKEEDEFKAKKEMEKKKENDAKKAIVASTSTSTTIPSLSVADCLPTVRNRWNGPDYDKEYTPPIHESTLSQQQISALHSGMYGQVGINPNSGNMVANRANGGLYPVTSGDFERLGGSDVPGYYGEQPEMRSQFGGGELSLR